MTSLTSVNRILAPSKNFQLLNETAANLCNVIEKERGEIRT